MTWGFGGDTPCRVCDGCGLCGFDGGCRDQPSSPRRPHPSMPSSPTAAVSASVAADAGVPSSYPGLLAVLASVPDPRARRGVRHRVAGGVGGLGRGGAGRGPRVHGDRRVGRRPVRPRSWARWGSPGGSRRRPTIRRVLSADRRGGVGGGGRGLRVDPHRGDRGPAGDRDRRQEPARRRRRRMGSCRTWSRRWTTPPGPSWASWRPWRRATRSPPSERFLKALDLTGCGGHDRCHAHPGRHRPADPGRWRRLRPDRESEPPQAVGRAQSLALEAGPGRTRPPTRGRGRRITRTIKVLQAPTDLPDWVGFPGAAQVAQIRRTRTTTTKHGPEEDRRGRLRDHLRRPPARHRHGCWRPGCNTTGGSRPCTGVRDMDYDEDRSQIRTGTGPETMATLRNTAISLLRLAGATNIAAALRHHQRPPRQDHHPADQLKHDNDGTLGVRCGGPFRRRTS